MKIIVRVVGFLDLQEIEWPEGWPIPGEGEQIWLPAPPTESGNRILIVRSVSWYPLGDNPEVGDPEPHVYVVVAPKTGSGRWT